ncbi:MAG: tetratricopeptide repeat protein [Candidatus Kapabacteria bacterium]|nr:tetratricopeptide repeat protein [Candidatus Kapabacteria bacterium]
MHWLWFGLLLIGCISRSTAQIDQARLLLKQGNPEEALRLLQPLLAKGDETAYTLAGDLWMELEQPDSALSYYYRIPKATSKPAIVARVGSALVAIGKFKEAIALLRKARDQHPQNVDIALALAHALLQSDSLQQAEYIVLRTREFAASDPRIYTMLGDLYYRQRVYELARQNYEHALRLDSLQSQPRIRLAEVYFRLAQRESDRELATEYYRRSLLNWDIVTRTDSANARAFYEKGRLFFFARRYEDAASALNRYVQLRPKGSLGRWYLAQALVELRRCDNAIPHLDTVVQELDTARPRALLLKARCLFEVNRYHDADRVYGEVLRDAAAPADAADWERAGVAALLSTDTARAIERFRYSLALDPRRCALSFRLGTLLYGRQQYSDAIAVFRQRLQTCSDTLDNRVYALIATAFLAANQPDSALPALSASLRLDSTNLFPYRLMIAALMALRRYAEAESTAWLALRRAQQQKDRQGADDIVTSLCAPWLEAKDFTRLQRLGREATRLAPNSPKAWVFLGLAYHGLNDAPNACRAYREALRRDPSESTAQQNLKLLNCP